MDIARRHALTRCDGGYGQATIAEIGGDIRFDRTQPCGTKPAALDEMSGIACSAECQRNEVVDMGGVDAPQIHGVRRHLLAKRSNISCQQSERTRLARNY